jgi:hypothetical protein
LALSIPALPAIDSEMALHHLGLQVRRETLRSALPTDSGLLETTERLAGAGSVAVDVDLADPHPGREFPYAKLWQTGEGSANIQRILIADDALGWKKMTRHENARVTALGRSQR